MPKSWSAPADIDGWRTWSNGRPWNSQTRNWERGWGWRWDQWRDGPSQADLPGRSTRRRGRRTGESSDAEKEKEKEKEEQGVRARQRSQTRGAPHHAGPAKHSATGEVPTTSLPAAAWPLGHSRRKVRRGRPGSARGPAPAEDGSGAAEEGDDQCEESSDLVEASKAVEGLEALSPSVREQLPGWEATLAAAIAERDKLQTAKLEGSELMEATKAVEGLEALSPAVREQLPGWEAALAAAIAERDKLQAAKRASRPLQWRLVEATRLVSSRSAALVEAGAAADRARAHRDEADRLLTARKTAAADARSALAQAQTALSAIQAEVGSRGGSHPEVPLEVLNGLSVQVEALPRAIRADNGMAAAEAIAGQFRALLAALGLGEQAAAAAAGAAAAGAATAAGLAGSPRTPVAEDGRGVPPACGTAERGRSPARTEVDAREVFIGSDTTSSACTRSRSVSRPRLRGQRRDTLAAAAVGSANIDHYFAGKPKAVVRGTTRTESG